MIFTEKPAGFIADIQVVACYVVCDEQFILLQRQSHKVHGGQWGLPAGKIDAGETASTAVIREVFEETGITITVADLRPRKILWVSNQGHHIEYFTFVVELSARPEIVLSVDEHKAFAWVSPTDSLAMNQVHDLADCTRLFFL